MPRPSSTLYQSSVRKSNSLPNLLDIDTNFTTTTQCSSNQSSAKNSPHHTPFNQLQQQQQQQQRPKQLNVSQAVSATALINNGNKCSRNMLPMCQIPICCDSVSEMNSENCADHQQEQELKQKQQLMLNNKHRHKHHRHSNELQYQQHQVKQQQPQQQQQQNNMSSTYSSSSGSSHTPAFNLVKLFIKQKSNNSSSGEGENEVEGGAAVLTNAQNNTCMDVSSGCWPSSDAAGSSSSSSSMEQKLRKKSMNDSGKGSALSKHEEEEETTQAVFYDNEAAATQHRIRVPSILQSSNLRRHTQVSNFLNNNNNNNKLSVGSSQQSSSSEQMTQIEISNKGRVSKQQEASSEMITRSMQTSCSTGSLTSTTTTRNNSFNERLRLVPPSFLSKLHKLGETCQAPIYVIYPNYALPDLGFVKTDTTTDKPDIIYSSFNYSSTTVTGKSVEIETKTNQNRFSANCSEPLQSMNLKHVQDWQSLLTLLPLEYRERVKHLPEVQKVLKLVEKDTAQQPLFCMTPPAKPSRSNICDCTQYNIQEDTQQTQVGAEVCGSASSGSSQQPNSSGYRGSSTLLTDSELDRNFMSYDPLKQMYVYQYERLDSGVECTPKTPTPPQAKPRSILRRSPNVGNKRNSMIETPQQHTRLSKLEKRRSLQEPPYAHLEENTSQELAKVFEDEELLYTTPPTTRLSRRDLDARARAENFLSALPRSELKYYAEIAAILESSADTTQQQVPAYDAAALKKEVSRALSQQQKKVSFNDAANEQNILPPTNTNIIDAKRFSTPPNSPNISMARLQNGTQSANRYSTIAKNKPQTLDAKEHTKIEHNRFKRLQIQWELMSKDSSMLKELALAQQTQSGGSTPTSAPITPKSRIPRPVSYPAGK